MKHVLGIDAGGTKTVCLLGDEQGRILAEARGGGANLNTAGELGVEMVLHAVMEEAIGDREVTPAVICLGMAGVDRDDDYRTVRSIMRRIGYRAPVLIVNDALVALEAGAKEGPGIVVIAGTGSIAYGRDTRNRAARAGGWGHVLGDEGSGYWIGRQALQAVMRQADGRGPATALTTRVLAHFGVEKPSELVRVVYYADVGRQAVAALGPLVESAYHEGDEVAVRILRGAAGELLAAARSVTRQLTMEEEAFPFILAGGIFHAVPWLASAVSSGLAAVAARSTIRLLETEPATGAIHLAIAERCGGAKLPHYV